MLLVAYNWLLDNNTLNNFILHNESCAIIAQQIKNIFTVIFAEKQTIVEVKDDVTLKIFFLT